MAHSVDYPTLDSGSAHDLKIELYIRLHIEHSLLEILSLPPLALFPAHTCMHAFSLSKEINKAFKKLLRLDQLKINILFTGFLISANKSSPINYNFCVLFCFVLHFSQLIKKTDFEVELSCDAFFSGNPYTQ